MADKDTKRYMELQMEEMKTFHANNAENNDTTSKNNSNSDREKEAEIAKLYEDLAEYEEDLECFEKELEIVKTNALKDISKILTESLQDEERDYEQELKTVLESGWTHMIEVLQTHPKEQLEIIRNNEFSDIEKKLSAAYPESNGTFETDIRNLLVQRWETLIAIKKEHIKEEIAEIKTSGLKPHYAKRVYKRYHGIK
jgi:tetratricopeptide (TPR) repeat protein